MESLQFTVLGLDDLQMSELTSSICAGGTSGDSRGSPFARKTVDFQILPHLLPQGQRLYGRTVSLQYHSHVLHDFRRYDGRLAT